MSGSSKGYYAKVKGTFWRHDRTSSLSLAARGLWVSLLSWSSDQASDGAISARGLEMAAGLRADKESVRSHAKALEELLAAELLVRVGNAFQLRDWTQHNITKAQYETQKEAVKKRVNKSRGKAEVTRDESPDDALVTPDVTRYKPATEQVTKPLPSDQDQDQDQDQDFLEKRGERARSTSVPVETPVSTTPTAHAEAIRQAWVAEFKRRGLAVDRRLHRLVDIEFLKFADGLTLELFRVNVARWFADPAMVDAGFPVGWFMKNPNQWGAKAKATTRDGGDDRQRPATTTIPAWMGEQP